ncbi:MAG: murein L,D-transpeptidase catalytic domain family protein [Bacteroidota bacterium]|nr:murein L,D-transpeptidase catalytic domain family protein [Bacteroidota bacterium]
MRRKLYVFLASALVINFLFVYATSKPFDTIQIVSNSSDTSYKVVANNLTESNVPVESNTSLYDSLQLNRLNLSRNAFNLAMQGYNKLLSEGRLNNTNLVSIVDFSLPSSKKRLFVIDLEKKEVVYNTYVAHGRNSGKEMASEFSNEPESNKSSLGLYTTGATYVGKHGFSLKLSGEEKGINDNANSRAIVMHSAAYVSEAAIKMQGFIGRSLGCPALPENIYRPIIEKIKKGSCLFLYSPDKYYAMHSTIAKKLA